jgi:transcriptional regulator with XRE-family HTH domain
MTSSGSRSQIKLERTKRGWSQTALGSRCGLPASTISALERGYTHPWPAWRRRIAGALGVSERELFSEVVDLERIAPRAASAPASKRGKR